eukprot:GHVS01045225.1.p1 GENE.GHVS01045225.1~~GHVS01045225.1.p1  ORF type:complete len:415 (+),score=91.62 GHVS01045225.1:284-1528(+)
MLAVPLDSMEGSRHGDVVRGTELEAITTAGREDDEREENNGRRLGGGARDKKRRIRSEGQSLQLVCGRIRRLVGEIGGGSENCSERGSSTGDSGAGEQTVKVEEGGGGAKKRQVKVGSSMTDLCVGSAAGTPSGTAVLQAGTAECGGDGATEEGDLEDERGSQGEDPVWQSQCLFLMMKDKEWCDRAIEDVIRRVREPPANRSAALSRAIDSCMDPQGRKRLKQERVGTVDLTALSQWIGDDVGGNPASGRIGWKMGGPTDKARRSGEAAEWMGVDPLQWSSTGGPLGRLFCRTANIPERFLEKVEELASVDAELEQMAALLHWGAANGRDSPLEGSRRAEALLRRHCAVLRGLSSWLDEATEQTDLLGVLAGNDGLEGGKGEADLSSGQHDEKEEDIVPIVVVDNTSDGEAGQ